MAALIYRRHLHVINLFQWPDPASRPAQVVRQQGYVAFGWSVGGMRYIAVSDLNEGELAQFVHSLGGEVPGPR